jgi:leucyl aminopeptidase
MSDSNIIKFRAISSFDIANLKGKLVFLVNCDGVMDEQTVLIDTLINGALKSFISTDIFHNFEPGECTELNIFIKKDILSILVFKKYNKYSFNEARLMGANISKAINNGSSDIIISNDGFPEEVAFGVKLRSYSFSKYKKLKSDNNHTTSLYVLDVPATKNAFEEKEAISRGVSFTRDLINEPANVLTTQEFSNRLQSLESIGIRVEVLNEKDLEKIGMRTLLCVGQGSDSESKVVIMHWDGGNSGGLPLALVGKGVVFDTGGISIKPAGGMEDMTMDMGGAGVVAGVMKALALRKAKANVIGIVGLVENMPSGKATRPGDVIKSLKGDTIEVINTDAEGRLVLADLLWYAQKKFKPSACIDLATLTGAIINSLGHEHAGLFSNSNRFVENFLNAAVVEKEGVWRLPLGPKYDKLLKSRVADMKNVGGKAAGSITAAQFIQRFVAPEMPWIHLDIAGVASIPGETDFSGGGATGWGVRTINSLISKYYEK